MSWHVGRASLILILILILWLGGLPSDRWSPTMSIVLVPLVLGYCRLLGNDDYGFGVPILFVFPFALHM